MSERLVAGSAKGEFGEVMEKDFQAAPKHFWKPVRQLRRGKRGTIQAVCSKDGTLLT